MKPAGERNEPIEHVGQRVRQMRLAKGLTLRQASRLCGVPVSTFSNIESGNHAVSLKNLMRIAAGFEVPPTALFSPEAMGVTEDKVSPGYRITYQYEGMTAELLTRHSHQTGLHVFLLTYQAGTRQPWSEPHSGWEYVYMLDGEVEMIVEGEEPVRLERNDFFYFRSDRRHMVHALTRASLILIGFGVGFLPGRR